MGSSSKASSQRTDFFWSYSDEPHATRRKEILAKYPQVKELFGHDPSTKYVVAWWVLSQLAVAYVLRESSWGLIVLIAYCYGGFAAHALFLAMHEICHNLAFAKSIYNRFLGFFANSVTVVPHFSMFTRYHMEHHQYQGVDGVDADVPTTYEGDFFTNSVKKALWVFFQPLFYVIRPLFLKPKKPGVWEAINWSSCLIADIIIGYTWGPKAVVYLFLSGFLGSGLHPIAGHCIAVHYVFIKGQ